MFPTTTLAFLFFIERFGKSLAKWASRYALGLSASVPAIKFEQENIIDEPDISLFSSTIKIFFGSDLLCLVSGTGSDMTDGAGLINKLPLLQMHERFEWNTFPTAVQCRLGGSKVLEALLHIYRADISQRDCFTFTPTQTMMPRDFQLPVFGDLK
jgi:RNA-dependent RNA polymerase